MTKGAFSQARTLMGEIVKNAEEIQRLKNSEATTVTVSTSGNTFVQIGTSQDSAHPDLAAGRALIDALINTRLAAMQQAEKSLAAL